ncbi:MAG: EAL domain-containing protein [Desulfobacteraceae bacterium]
MDITNFKKTTIGKRLLVSYFGLLLTAVLVSTMVTAPLVQDLVQNRIKNELETTIDLFHNLVKTAAEISIKNHLRTIVSTNIKALEFLQGQVVKERMTLDEAKRKAEIFFSSQTIGKTGYIYTLSTAGKIVTHPKKDLESQSLLHNDFVKQQISSEKGYIEYLWKNPDDAERRKKALSFEHFKPWNWIVSASSYTSEFKDLLRVEDLKNNIEALEFGKTGYAFLLAKDGQILIHPQKEKLNRDRVSDLEKKKILDQIISRKNGRIEYLWNTPGEKKQRKKIVYFKYIPQFELIIGASGYKNELYSPVYKTASIFLGSLVFLVLAGIPLIIWLSRSITGPIGAFTRKIQHASRGNLDVRIPDTFPGEIGGLARYFNQFMDELSAKNKRLESEMKERKTREEEIRILAKFPDENPHPVMRVTRRHTISYFNASAAKTLETFDLKLEGKLPGHFSSLVERAFKTGRPVETEYSDNGSTFSFTISPYQDIASAYIYGKEITAQKAYESLLVLSDAFFQNSIEGICITDTHATIERINPLFTEITGYTEEEVIGKKPSILKSDKHDAEFYREMWQQIKSRGQWAGEIWNRRKNGQAYPEWLSISAIPDKNGNIIKYIGIFHDITESVLNKEKLHYQTYHDAITGLPNRKLFTDVIERNINLSRKREEKFALLFIDLNNFKNINDTLGHITGDTLLHLLAENLKQNAPEEMVIARFVGDKFIVFAPEAKDQNRIMKEASAIQKIIQGPYQLKEREIFCNSNIGISIFPHDGNTAEVLIKNAEMAMFRGKNTGKRGISFFTSSMDEVAAQRLETEQNLASALLNGEFELYFQPKVSLSTGEISGAEALIRWIKDGEVISPALFIPVAEETGYMVPMGEWVMKTAFETISRWSRLGHQGLTMSVNLSGVQFQDTELLDKIETFFKETGANPESLKFEITESVVMSDPALAYRVTAQLKEMGSEISIDDFGTGYSSLGYLKKFPFDELKIDKSFLDDFPGSNEDLSIVKSILSLASNLNLKVTAEGVETKQQADMLKRLKCDEIQGFYFSRPVREEAFLSLVASKKNLEEITPV